MSTAEKTEYWVKISNQSFKFVCVAYSLNNIAYQLAVIGTSKCL